MLTTERSDRIASILIDAMASTQIGRARFADEQGSPPTNMWAVHHLRSVVQARVLAEPDWTLESAYADHGRVAIEGLNERRVVLRSAVGETFARVRNHGVLFDPNEYVTTDDLGLVYNFDQTGFLNLAVGPMLLPKSGAGRAIVKQPLTDLGTWSLSEGSDVFDQDSADHDFDFLNEAGPDLDAGDV